MHIDDERAIGNSIIVTLKYGWEFGTDPWQARHVEAFDSMREAKEGIRLAVKCDCGECKKELAEIRKARREAKAKKDKALGPAGRMNYQLTLIEQKARNLRADWMQGDHEKMFLTLNGIKKTAEKFMMDLDEIFNA